jgi:3-hydroxymyristoyl/3-hydroxydecanoyl-(acyl carrier protein) dehydratase
MKLPVIYPDLLELIPQRPPFVMVDELSFFTVTLAKSRFQIKKDCLLLENNRITEAGITENIAQTAALSSGYKANISNQTPPVGFIGAIKSLQIYLRPEVGATLETHVEFLHQIGNVSIIQGKSFFEGELVAECEMKIFLQENPI